MKYIKKFEKEADIMMEVQPNVVLAADTGKVSYNVPKLQGVFIQHVDGALYTEEGWIAAGFTNEDANGVAVITDNARFVIAKNDLGQMAWSSLVATVDGVMLTTDKDTAMTDFEGYNNTQLMLATDTSGASYSCANYTFPNGSKGYLPALGEWNEAYANRLKINSLMTTIGGSEISTTPSNGTVDVRYWSSTQYASYRAWRFEWARGWMTGTHDKNHTNGYVRAFSALSL